MKKNVSWQELVVLTVFLVVIPTTIAVAANVKQFEGAYSSEFTGSMAIGTPCATCPIGTPLPPPVAYDCALQSSIPVGECEILRTLFNETNGEWWYRNAGWLANNDPCSWHGVTCASGNVSTLNLPQNKLTGFIPQELGGLSFLQFLDLSYNKLDGTIPIELGNISNLQYLYLQGNRFCNGIPVELGTLGNLLELDLEMNLLCNQIPAELGNLNNLQSLNISSNNFSGTIPPELGNLTNIQVMNMQGSGLSGDIPPQLGNLPKIQTLMLCCNAFTSIPPELGNLNTLQTLNLHSNDFSGPIPPVLGSLNSLQDLNLHNSNFTGPIPPELGNLSNLQQLSLSYNQLSGSVPVEIGNLSNLNALYLVNNPNLTGPLPLSLTNLTMMDYFYYHRTDLCEPQDAAFLAWYAGIYYKKGTGVACAVTPACYSLTLSHTGNGAHPAASPANSTGCNAGEYLAGENVVLTASPSGGWGVKDWSGTINDTSTATINMVTMPAGAHSASVHYGKALIAYPGFESAIPNRWGQGKNLEITDTMDCTIAHSGTCSYTMTGNGTNKVIYAYYGTTGSAGDTVDFSVWRKAAGYTGSGPIIGRVVFIHSAGGTKDFYDLDLKGGDVTQWEQFSQSVAATADYRMVTISLLYGDSGGQAWFDDISTVLNGTTQLIVYPGFESAIPNRWGQGKNLEITDTMDCTQMHSGTCSYTMTGNGVNKVIYAYYGYNGLAGDTVDFSVWRKAAGYTGSGPIIGRVVFIHSAGGTKDFYDLDLTGGDVTQWEQFSQSVAATADYRMVTISLLYGGSGGAAWFDDISAYLYQP